MNAHSLGLLHQSLVGPPSRTYNHYSLHTPSKLPGGQAWRRILQLPSRPEYHPIALCIFHWQHLPLLFVEAIFRPDLHIPV
jgi:hypothetical protein